MLLFWLHIKWNRMNYIGHCNVSFDLVAQTEVAAAAAIISFFRDYDSELLRNAVAVAIAVCIAYVILIKKRALTRDVYTVIIISATIGSIFIRLCVKKLLSVFQRLMRFLCCSTPLFVYSIVGVLKFIRTRLENVNRLKAFFHVNAINKMCLISLRSFVLNG